MRRVAVGESRFRCSGCGAILDEMRSLPFRCDRAGEGGEGDHVLVRELAPGTVRFPAGVEPGESPFLAYKDLLHARRLGRAAGLSDAQLDTMVRRLDEAARGIEGRGFVETPLRVSEPIGRMLGFARRGGVLVKDETGNVAGSHKARHLFGVLHYVEVRERIGSGPGARSELVIASCGNAALAAALLARAAGRALRVFVPPKADEVILSRLRDLGARVERCPRRTGELGDPCVARFREAVARGAIPFTCQGSECALAIEGGHTLGWEMVTALGRMGRTLTRLFIQVGGGALASACVGALREAYAAGRIEHLPRIHAVQTRGAHPLERAHRLVVERLVRRIRDEEGARAPAPEEARALFLKERFGSRAVRDELDYAATHRSEFMWPWEETPRSLAEGILDDEAYDWRAVVEGMLESGGYPVIVEEDDLRAAREAANRAAPRGVGFTGAAGLAGLMRLVRRRVVGPEETVGVLFTGVARGRGG